MSAPNSLSIPNSEFVAQESLEISAFTKFIFIYRTHVNVCVFVLYRHVGMYVVVSVVDIRRSLLSVAHMLSTVGCWVSVVEYIHVSLSCIA